MPLKPFQKSDIARAAMHDGVILAWEPGMGKSLAAVAWPLVKKARRTLIVAPDSLHHQLTVSASKFFRVYLNPFATNRISSISTCTARPLARHAFISPAIPPLDSMMQTSGAIASPGPGLHAPIKFSSLVADRGADATSFDMTKIAEHPSERRKTASHASGPPPLHDLPNPTAHSTALLLMKAHGFKPPTRASDPAFDFSNPAFDLFSLALPSKTDWRAFLALRLVGRPHGTLALLQLR